MYLSKAVSKQNKIKLLRETKKIYRLFTVLQEETNKGDAATDHWSGYVMGGIGFISEILSQIKIKPSGMFT